MTSSINNITGDHCSSKLGTREDMARYAQGWDRIFGAKNKESVTVTDNSVMNTPYDRYYIQADNKESGAVVDLPNAYNDTKMEGDVDVA